MGKGIDAARAIAPLHAAVLDDFKDQLLIVLIKRLGGRVDIPVAEVGATGSHILSFSVEDRIFKFVLGSKQ